MNNSEISTISELDFVNSNRGYWFIRTDNGINFDTYTKNDFIGIGWNEITLEDITNLHFSEVYLKIAKTYGYNLELARGKSKVTAIYNKLHRFKEIKKGDIIIIPSYGSQRLAFGVVEDSKVYIDLEKIDDCDYYKRKKVNWIITKDIDSLDSKFYEVKTTRHAISNVKPYESYIDRVVSTFYFKDNTGNLVFEVNKDEDINLTSLLELITNIKSVISDINIQYNFDENIEESAIKLSLQSRGTFALKVPIGKSLATFGVIFALFSCGDKGQQNNNLNPKEQQEADKFIKSHKKELDKIEESMRELEVNQDKINETFK